MARSKTTRKAARNSESSKVTISRNSSDDSWMDKIQNDLQTNQSYLNLILGALIVIVLGVLLFNYFTKPSGNLGPSQQADQQEQQGDVAKESLPGNYTVKEGDTLSLIAQAYYDDMSKYTAIMEENKLTSENIEVGQVLTIPNLNTSPAPAAESSPAPEASPAQEAQASPEASPAAEEAPGTGGAENQTTWGEKITGDTYTVQAEDWLSKIAGRAYGDIFAYDRIAQANNIQNPNAIEVGIVLKIPRQ